MFVVYSPEGRNYISAGQPLPDLKVDRSQKVLAEGDSEMDQFTLPAKSREGRDPKSHNAIEQYQQVQSPTERQVVVKVAEIMSQPVMTIEQEATITQAWERMQQSNVHHLPVVNETGRLIGLLTHIEILQRVITNPKGMIEEAMPETVADVMIREVITTKVETDIRKVAFVMSEYAVGCLPIMSEQEDVIGVVTLSDIVRRLAELPPLEIYV